MKNVLWGAHRRASGALFLPRPRGRAGIEMRQGGAQGPVLHTFSNLAPAVHPEASVRKQTVRGDCPSPVRASAQISRAITRPGC
jgi:hypothetical protein